LRTKNKKGGGNEKEKEVSVTAAARVFAPVAPLSLPVL
jgi:hypothetical protein